MLSFRCYSRQSLYLELKEKAFQPLTLTGSRYFQVGNEKRSWVASLLTILNIRLSLEFVCNVALNLQCVDEILGRDHSNETYQAVLFTVVVLKEKDNKKLEDFFTDFILVTLRLNDLSSNFKNSFHKTVARSISYGTTDPSLREFI